MIPAVPMKGRVWFAWLSALLLLVAGTVLIGASGETTSNKQTPYWKKPLPSSSCPWSSSDTNCHHSSPVLADITGDGMLEIIAATNRGHVVVYRHDGSLLWDKDIAGAFGMEQNTQRIASSPAAADIDADGRLEIVVGTGTIHRSICTQGGVIVLDHDGAVKNGWPFLTKDHSIPPENCRDSVFSTPALGDLDKDGTMEIVFGSFDKRIYAVNQNGQALPGFPSDSHHFQRFGWDNLRGSLADSIWSSPSLADLDGDGFLDIIIGTDEGNYDGRWQPVTEEWHCPYQSPGVPGYCGGSLYVVDRFGKLVPGFPQYKLEIIQSTPALHDIDGDDLSEIFVGTGGFYHSNSPDRPENGFRLFGIDNNGSDLPGWQGGKIVGGVVKTSPAIGDIDGDGSPEVVVTAGDKKLYAFHLNGTAVSGFPMTPLAYIGEALDSYSVGSTVILADYTGNGIMEILVRHAWETIIVDGSGKQLTARYLDDTKPTFVTNGPLWNSPAVGDLDGDGHLELVSQNSELTVWQLMNSSDKADWPMLKQNASRSGLTILEIIFEPGSMQVVHEAGQTVDHIQRLNLISYGGSFDWTLNTNNGSVIRFPQKSGTVIDKVTIDVEVKITGDMPPGSRNLGSIDLTIMQNGKVYEQADIVVEVVILENLNQNYVPYIP